jgi:hypothetical protein
MMMTAEKFVSVYGKFAVGMVIATAPMGEYPGGMATVVELAPDPAAPEIAFNVKHPTAGVMGVFGTELVDPGAG